MTDQVSVCVYAARQAFRVRSGTGALIVKLQSPRWLRATLWCIARSFRIAALFGWEPTEQRIDRIAKWYASHLRIGGRRLGSA